LLLLFTTVVALEDGKEKGEAAPNTVQAAPQPVLAYYYIWFDPSSWARAKTDFPVLGHYSSDERQVMRQHIKWAKDAGIEGFIVSWKNSTVLNRRLERLMEIAQEEDFKLAMIYQGLDFYREPLPVSRVAADFDIFIERYASHPTFAIFDKPIMIWSGTWKFSVEEVAGVTEGRRKDLLILASERNPEEYERLATHVDGDAYYWSAVDPLTDGSYQKKLTAMSEAIHAHNGLWLSPVAPGFDARLIGGERVVERRDGETLRREMDAAMIASPDAIGVISWNEFSENTHIEPSENHGARYLEVLADILGGTAPAGGDIDSSEPGGVTRTNHALPLFGAMAALLVGGLALIGWRRHQEDGRKYT
jgi:hypothetical protein